jgi:hypothetical protein
MLQEWNDAEGPGPWEDSFAPRRTSTDGYPAGNEPPHSAGAHPETPDFASLMRRIYPLRMRRIERDRRWLRKKAVKYGVDPDAVA